MYIFELETFGLSTHYTFTTMKSTSSGTRNLTITFTTLAILASALGAYYFVYVEQRATLLNERNFRVLSQIQKNVVAKNAQYKQVTANVPRDLTSIKQRVTRLVQEQLVFEWEKETTLEYEKVHQFLLPIITKDDSVYKSILIDDLKNRPADFYDFLEGWTSRNQSLNLPPLPPKDDQDKLIPYVWNALQVNIDEQTAQIFASFENEFWNEVTTNPAAYPKTIYRWATYYQRKSNSEKLQGFLDRIDKKDRRTVGEIDFQDGFFAVIVQDGRRQSTRRVDFDAYEAWYQRRVNLSYKIQVLDEGHDAQEDKEKAELRKNADNTWDLTYTTFADHELTADQHYHIRLDRPMNTFMEDLLRPDVFDDLLVLKLGEVSESGDGRVADLVYQYSQNTLKIDNLPDTLLSPKGGLGIQANTLRELLIGGTDYLVYLQPMTLNQDEMVLCGLVETRAFTGEKFRIATLVILLMVLLLFTMIVLLPVLRLKLMSRYERMGTSDVVFTMVAAILGTAAAVLLLFDVYGFNGPDANLRKQEMVDFSNQISGEFFDELEHIYDQLAYYDTLDVHGDMIGQELMDSAKISPQYYPYFTSVFWVNAHTNYLDQEFTTRSVLTPKVDVSGRSYLQRIVNGEAWTLPDHSGTKGSRKFMLESILTRTTGDNLAVVSKKSRKDTASIIFLATKLYSLIQPVIPLGFGYCVIDENGEVLFHSDEKRNLQENFLEETNKRALNAAVYARSSLYTNATYQGKNFDVYLKPLENLPLYLITFQDREYYISTHEQIVSFTFILILIGFALGLAVIILMIALTPYRSRLYVARAWFSWLRPKRRHINTYRILLCANFVTLVIFFFFSRGERALGVINMFGLANIYTFLLAYLALEDKKIYIVGKKARKRYRFLFGAVVLLVGLNFAAYAIASDDYWGNWDPQANLFDIRGYFPYQLLQIVVCLIALKLIRRFSPSDDTDEPPMLETKNPQVNFFLQRFNEFFTRQRSFRFFLLSWLAILSVFPSVQYYSISYNREMKLAIKYAHVQFAKDIEARELRLEQNFSDRALPPSDLEALKHKGIYTEAFFKTIYGSKDMGKMWDIPLYLPDTLQALISPSWLKYDSLLSRIRPRYSDLVRTTNQLRNVVSSDNSWQWEEGVGYLKGQPHHPHRYLAFTPKNGLPLISYLHTYHLPNITTPLGLLFWLIFMVVVGSMYLMIDYTTRRLFAESLLDMTAPNDDEARSILAKTKQHAFLVIPPRAMGSKYKREFRNKMLISLKEIQSLEDFWKAVEAYESNRFPDRSPEEHVKSRRKQVLNLNHFEVKIDQRDIALLRLVIVKEAMEQWRQVVLVGAIDPLEIDDYYTTWLEQTEDASLRQQLTAEKMIWTETLSRFYKISLPFESDPLIHGDEAHEELISEECGHGAFLRNMFDELIELYKGKEHISPEDIILDIELRAQLYYQVLWSTSNREERFIMFDLAQDGLVNDRNVRAIKSLLNKGLLVNTGDQLQVMNRSFRNFILTEINREDTLTLEHRINRESAWVQIRTPIMIILFALGAFLLTTQEQLLNDARGIITASAAALPALYTAIEKMTGINILKIFTKKK